MGWGQSQAFGGHGGDEFRAACTDSLLIRAGIDVVKPHPGAADVRGLSVLQMAKSMLDAAGHSTQGLNTGQVFAAGNMSSSDFPLLLGDSVNKALMHGYRNAPATHRIWTRAADLRHFKNAQRIK
jgi:hypothetical protein